MLEIAIPGLRTLRLEYLVLDYNGTLAVDGKLIEGVTERLQALSQQLTILVVTADTFGKARSALAGMPCQLEVLPAPGQDQAKLAYVQCLGCERVAAVGNGRNDRLMLEVAALGIAVIGQEGASAETLTVAQVVAPHINNALDLLLNPLRLVATLRS